MAEVLIVASLITAFIAGIAALFAPCCITVLLPAYLGSIFRQRRTVLLMTGIFFLGLLAIFLPLGLGFATLGQFFRDSHTIVFTIGGSFMLILGLSILLGIRVSMPFMFHPSVKLKGAVSVFILGMFSGIATLCCAPVLAGVFALSVLPGSVFWGSMYALLYTLGMVAPLFILAYFLDKPAIAKRMDVLKKEVLYGIGSRNVRLTLADMLAGATFFLMGMLILALNATGKLAMGGGAFQTSVNIIVSNLTSTIINAVTGLHASFWKALGIALIALAILKAIFIKRKKRKHK
jgi:cytochrome c biogenesis protein CcdA